MSRFNDGLIRTNSKCIGCNYCVKSCPVPGANVSRIDKNGKAVIKVLDKNCTHCGKCIGECMQDAREYLDDFDALKKDLKEGEKISVMLDPQLYLEYPLMVDDVVIYLKSLGVKHVLDASVGGAISLYCNVKYLKENADERGICNEYLAHLCAGASNYFALNQPQSIQRFIPVQLPQMCAAIYFKKYKNVKEKIALISPCVAIQDEAKNENYKGNIEYVIGISRLLDSLPKDTMKNLREKYNSEIVKGDFAFVYPQVGTYATSVLQFMDPGTKVISNAGLNERLGRIVARTCSDINITHPVLSELMSCQSGCFCGPAIHKEMVDIENVLDGYFDKDGGIMSELPKDLNVEGRYQWLLERFKYIDASDFAWKSSDNYHQRPTVPKAVTDEIYARMHKDTKIKQNMNCQACGYDSCYDFVCAVACGYSRLENCIHYLNDEITSKALMDVSTGLPNQRSFFRNAQEYMDSNPDKSFALYSGDINNLSSINELYGSESGDKVIYAVAAKIKEYIARRGVAARFGGGVFALCMEEIEENEKGLLEFVNVDIKDTGVDFPVSMKWGKCTVNHEDDLYHQMGYASFAYHACKDRSKNTLSEYTQDMFKVLETEAKITQRMRRALENNEYKIFLQPKYDHYSKNLVGAEVLSRWIEEDGNLISPGVFIPLFERNGFIVDLDRVVWRNSFMLMQRWIDEGLNPVPISVNISRISLETESIIYVIEALKDEYPDCVKFIQFEITETAYSMVQNDIFARVQKIRDMGFFVAMDDFGSGYSSLNLLKDAPIDILKLDMGFLRGETNYERGQIIINSVIDMARRIDLDMVAEGVETKQQADSICKMGCNVIQGYFYAKPMPVEEYEKLLREEQKETGAK